LDPNNPDIMMQYVIALFFTNGNRINDESQALIDALRAQDLNNPDVLNLLAVDAYQREDYETAIAYWRQLLAMFATDPQAQQVLMSSIEQAQQALENEGGEEQTQAVRLDVNVELLDAFVNQVSPEQTVFVYVRAENGPAMPLAIVRSTVADLPLEVTLDDATSMIPALHLSDFTAVRIYARVSQNGQAEPQPGDLIGSSDIIDPTQTTVPINITIDQVFGNS
jgi:cytochrome c-type biogenesis protein CcmH